MQTVEATPVWNPRHSVTPTSFLPSEYHPSELVSTPRQLTSNAGPGIAAGHQSCENHYESPAEASYASLQRAITAAEAAQCDFQAAYWESKNELLSHDPNGFPSYATGARLNAGGPLPASAFSDWDSSRTSSVVWTPAPHSQLDDPFEFYNGILQQPQVLQQQASGPQEEYDGIHKATDMYGIPARPPVTTYPSQLVRHESETQQQLCLPEPSRHPPALPEEAFSRRSSLASELANTLGTIGIHPQLPQLQQRGLAFKQPEMPPLNIAARRNKRRPAALGTTALRSRSCAGPLSMSPTTIGPFLSPSTSVRRIKSTSSNLNVAHGRVQKVMPGSAQRSPLHFQNFAEIDAFDGANVLSPGNALASQDLPSSASLAPPTPLSPPDINHSQLPYPTDHHGHPFIYNSDFSGCFAPNTSGLDSNLASPPATPLNAEMLARMQQHALHHQQLPQPPQSAPPQLSSFPLYSPPSSTGPPTSSIWSDAPTDSPKIYSFPPTIHMPQPLYATPMNYGEPQIANDLSHQFLLQVQNKFPQGGSHHEFQIDSGPKEPEFFFHEFPQQKQAHQQISKQLEPHKPKNYIFANATPDDF